MLPHSYKFYHVLRLNNLLQVFLTRNQRDQVTPFIYINWDNEVSNLVRGGRFLGDMKYLIKSIKRAAEAVGIWTEENWYVNRMNLMYTMVSGKFNIKKRRRLIH